jgi:hypothetical protein
MKKRAFFLGLALALSLSGFPGGVPAAQAAPPRLTSAPLFITVGGVEIPAFVLKNKYAYRLIFPLADRASAQAAILAGGEVRLGNILHQNRLWSAIVDPAKIVAADVVNQPIAPGVFHFGAAFHFGETGLTLFSNDGTTIVVKELVLGTGPEKAFSIDGTIGLQLLQMRASSMEAFEGTKPLNPKVRNRLDPRRIDIGLFFLAEIEETARLAALTAIRALRAEYPEKTDNPEVQKYHFLGANCISSGIQNLTRAAFSEHHSAVLRLGGRDIKAIPAWDREIARETIQSWTDITLLTFEGLRGGTIDQKEFAAVAAFHKNLRSHNQMSLPWRAKRIIDWSAGKR